VHGIGRERIAVERAAWSAPGVSSVRNIIDVDALADSTPPHRTTTTEPSP
jgi:hypothetical protein